MTAGERLTALVRARVRRWIRGRRRPTAVDDVMERRAARLKLDVYRANGSRWS